MKKTRVMLIIDKCRRYKRILMILAEIFLFSCVLVFSYWIRLGALREIDFWQVGFLLVVVVPIKIILFWRFKLYHISFRFISLYEIMDVLKASLLSTLSFSLVGVLFRDAPVLAGFPRSIILIDLMLTFLVGSADRIFFRWYYLPRLQRRDRRKVLIIGAGKAGERLAREILISSDYVPVAFVDDDPSKWDSLIHGVKVMGGKEDISIIVKGLGIEEIIIAIPSASPPQLKEIIEYARKSQVKNVKILPSLSHIMTDRARLGDLRKINVEDLVDREPMRIEEEKISLYLTGRRVLVTGAGGFIGAQLCRQIATFGPACLVMVDSGEIGLYEIGREIKERFNQTQVITIVADLKDKIRMQNILRKNLPQVVFHTAAYKHTFLMESNSREAVLNNIEATRIISEVSRENGVEKFIYTSSNTAVYPTSIMGATKRIAENLIARYNNEKSKFISVRLGNVLGSRGSVVHIFSEQIKEGRPIKITDPQITRYFITVTEAVQFILQSGAMGEGGEVFVLDMGKPIKILDLALNMIRLSGLEPDKDIPIVFTGLRPGEKLFEELLTAEEGKIPTQHERIFISRDTNNLKPDFMEKVEKLISLAKNDSDRESMVALVKDLVSTYQPG
jgi:FlaA1/EpsC-like NDP-sugar epimerase